MAESRIVAETRTEFGKGAARRARRAGTDPGAPPSRGGPGGDVWAAATAGTGFDTPGREPGTESMTTAGTGPRSVDHDVPGDGPTVAPAPEDRDGAAPGDDARPGDAV